MENPEPEKKPKISPTTKKLIWAAITIAVLAVVLANADWFREHLSAEGYRFVAGLGLGIQAAFGLSMFKRLLRFWRHDITRSGIINASMMIVIYLFAFIVGVSVWFAGWDGTNTGRWYGGGILIAGLLAQLGLAPLIENHK